MSSITLSLQTRTNLLALQTTQSLLGRTSQRLSTGLKVNAPIDNASAFFAAAALTNQADAFTRAQSDITQTSNTLTTAISGLQSIAKLVQNLQGLLSSLSTATTLAQSASLAGQYNTILTAIDNLADATSYQGINLINTATSSLGVSFSGQPGSNDITIRSLRSDSNGLGLTTIATGAFFALSTVIPSQDSRNSIASIQSLASVASRDVVNTSVSLESTDSVSSVASIASVQSQATQASNATNSASAASQASRTSIQCVASVASRASFAAVSQSSSVPSNQTVGSVASLGSTPSTSSVAGVTVAAVNTTLISNTNVAIGNALAQLSAAQSTLGSTNAILAVRLEFSKSYVATLQSGAASLTVADLNEESANLTSLQTAQSLGVVSLSITNQAQQSLLRLF